jgi:hypothetical protein
MGMWNVSWVPGVSLSHWLGNPPKRVGEVSFSGNSGTIGGLLWGMRVPESVTLVNSFNG